MKGLTLSNSNDLRKIHNSFARITTDEICSVPDPSAKESSNAQKNSVLQDADTYHFISYVPIHGSVYELDGLTARPVNIGAFGDDWIKVATPAIQQRIQK